MQVMVYWNIRRQQWSVQSRQTGRVAFHSSRLSLTDAEFRVSQAGRQRVLREKRKNVHAKVYGTLGGDQLDNLQKVRYNPYETETFVTEDGVPVRTAKLAVFLGDGRCYACGINESHV